MDGLGSVIEIFKGYGAAAPLIAWPTWLWWQERAERREMVGKVLQITAATITAEKDMTQAVNLLSARIG